MATLTPNYGLSMPDAADNYSDFRESYNENMEIIDENMGGGGGGDSVTWTQVQQTGTKIAEININGTSQDVYAPQGGGGSGDVSDVEVNGVSVVDPVSKVAEIISYKEVTQAEYDALPSSKLTDDVAYFIKDADNDKGIGLDYLNDVDITSPQEGDVLKYTNGKWVNGIGGSSSGHDYSTTEKKIGTWIDGKPIYEIVIPTVYTGSNIYDYPVATIPNYANITIRRIEGYSNGHKGGTSVHISMNFSHTDSNTWSSYFWVDDSTGEIKIGAGRSETVTNPLFIIQYTKLTD